MKKFFDKFLSEKFREQTERIIVAIAILSYLVHLLLIFLVSQDIIDLTSKLTKNPISAVYTPFSFILIYEVFLLVFYLPSSTSKYIGKQYEIITLIVIRRLFKDIGHIELSSGWFKLENDLQFIYDVITTLILFFLIQLFYKKIKKQDNAEISRTPKEKIKIEKFIKLKKIIATTLIPILIILALYSFINWFIGSIQHNESHINSFKNINNIFFEDFFMLLIIIDVLLLLFSFFHSDKFHQIIRNSGFVISTMLIKLSFSMEGLVNNVLIVGAVLFGLLILVIHNSYKNSTLPDY
jgi:hypothetical protein